MTIADYIRMERLKKGLTLRDLSRLTGLALSTLSGVENDKFHKFSTLKTILDTLDLTVEDATAAGVEWFAEKKKPEPTDFEMIVDYITASPENEDRVRKFLAYVDKLKGRS